MMVLAELSALTASSLTEITTVKHAMLDVKTVLELEFARNAPMDSTYSTANASRPAPLDTLEIVKKEFAKNVMMPARSAQTIPPLTVNTALKDISWTETLASKVITVDKEPTLILLQENALIARFPSAKSAWISILAINVSTDTQSMPMEDAQKLNHSLMSFLNLLSCFHKLLLANRDLPKSSTSTTTLKEPELDLTPYLSLSSSEESLNTILIPTFSKLPPTYLLRTSDSTFTVTTAIYKSELNLTELETVHTSIFTTGTTSKLSSTRTETKLKFKSKVELLLPLLLLLLSSKLQFPLLLTGLTETPTSSSTTTAEEMLTNYKTSTSMTTLLTKTIPLLYQIAALNSAITLA
jgi:hypothetical protein